MCVKLFMSVSKVFQNGVKTRKQGRTEEKKRGRSEIKENKKEQRKTTAKNEEGIRKR